MQTVIDGLIAEMKTMPVIDSHEHLPTEAKVISQPADVLTRVYCHYAITSAVAAGLPQEKRPFLLDPAVPLEKRWSLLRPYLDAMRETGYARAAQITVRELYGIDEITDGTYQDISEKLQADNTPGLYDRILKDKCRIERVLNQGSWDDGPNGYAMRVYRGFMKLATVPGEGFRAFCGNFAGTRGDQEKDLRDLVTRVVDKVIEDGAKGLKFTAGPVTEPIADEEAGRLWRKYRKEDIGDEEARTLGAWIYHRILAEAGRRDVTVAIHCGMAWNCWGDFRWKNPLNIVPLFMRHRETTFDLYHGGIPWVRAMAVIGNQYPNVNLDLVWAHQISPNITEQMLNEWMDLVPVNKIIAFGGDNPCGPEKTLGALVMARENIARALAVRVIRKQLSESRAVDICRAWLYDNPKRIYKL